MMNIQFGPLLIMYAGLLCALLAAYFGKRKAAKHNGNDEVQDHIFKTARSFSWYATIVTIYVMFTLYGVGVDMGVPPTIGIIMLVQMASWGISAPVLNYYYSVEKTPNMNGVIGILIILVSVALFIILAVVTENWLFLFWPIPSSIIGLYFIKQGYKVKEGDF